MGCVPINIIIINIIYYLSFDRISLSYVVNKIELAAQFQM